MQVDLYKGRKTMVIVVVSTVNKQASKHDVENRQNVCQHIRHLCYC